MDVSANGHIEDLLKGSERDFSEFFDSNEFAAREEIESHHYWHVYRRGVVHQMLRSALPNPDGPLIELGCGTGNIATYLNERGYHVDYADVHAEGLAIARGRATNRLGAERGRDGRPLRFVRLDITRQFPEGDYQGVLLLDVLEHLPDDHGVLETARARLARRPGSLLVFTVPAFPMLWSPWDEMQRHKRRYTLETARKLAQETGFEVLRLTYFFFPLFFAALGVKIVRTAREALGGGRPTSITDAVETKGGALNAPMLRLLALEQRWLASRDLPCGSSLICVARPV